MKIVKTKTSDGYHFKGLLSEAEDSKKIIIHIHGMAGSVLFNEYYPEMHASYPAAGYSFLAAETRGTGTITPFVRNEEYILAGSAFERFEDCLYDIGAWVDFAKAQGYEEIWLQAHSFGPSKVAYYISQTKDQDIRGCIWISPCDMVGLANNKETNKHSDEMMAEAKNLVSSGKGQDLLSIKLWDGELLSASTYLNLFGEGTKNLIFNYSNESLEWGIINAINLPVLAITGTQDSAVYPTMDAFESMKILEKELKNSPKIKTIVYDGADHSFDGFGEKIVSDVLDFIKN